MENENSEFIDYVKSYSKNVKTVQEMYVPLDGDELESIDEQCAMVKSGKAKKKVATKDYLTKSIQECLLAEAEKKEEEKPEDPRYQQLHITSSTQAEQDYYDESRKKAEKMNSDYNAAAIKGDVETAHKIKQDAAVLASTVKEYAGHTGNISNEPDKVTRNIPIASKGYNEVFDPKKVAEFEKSKKDAEKKKEDPDKQPEYSRMKKYHGK